MFLKRKVRYSALFTNLVGWHAGALNFPLSDVILAQLVCPLSDIMFYLCFGKITYLSTNIGSRHISLQKIHLRNKSTGCWWWAQAKQPGQQGKWVDQAGGPGECMCRL